MVSGDDNWSSGGDDESMAVVRFRNPKIKARAKKMEAEPCEALDQTILTSAPADDVVLDPTAPTAANPLSQSTPPSFQNNTAPNHFSDNHRPAPLSAAQFVDQPEQFNR